MASFQTLQNRVLTRLIDAPVAVQSDVPNFVNLAIRDLQDDTNFSVMKAIASFQTTLQTRTLGTLPNDYKERRGEAYWLDQIGGPTFMRWYTSHEGAIRRYSPQELKSPAVTITDQGQPQLLTTAIPVSAAGSTVDGPQKLEVWPLPDNAGYDLLPDGVTKTYTIYVPYWRYLTTLVNPTDTNWFTENGEQYIVEQTLGHSFLADWDETRAAQHFALAQTYMKKIVRKNANEAASPMQGMAVRSSALAERDAWRPS